MAFPGLFSLGGTEIINSSRTEAYARSYGVGWFRPVYRETALAWLLGDKRYTTPLQDDAPWTDSDDLNSYDFYGVYPLEITGLEDSTVTAEVVESVIDGGYVGKPRRQTRPVVFSAVLVGASECAVEYGLRWLRTALNGGPCLSRLPGNCSGVELCYLACPPVVGDVQPPQVPGDVVLDGTNRVMNPNVEANLNGWASNAGSLYPVTRDTTAPISGTASAMTTRVVPNKVTQGANGTFEGGNITGFLGSGGIGSEATVAASTVQAHTGTGSLKVTFGTGSSGASAAYVNLTGLTVGSVYTAECWIYVPGTPNLLTAGANGTFEGSISGWTPAGTPTPTVALSTAQKRTGGSSMAITWGTAGASATAVYAPFPTVIGQQYTVEAWLYIPTGGASSSVIVNGGVFNGNIISVRDQWALSSCTFTATGTTSTIELCHRVPSTAGQICYVDDARAFSVASNSVACAPALAIDGGSNKTPRQPVTVPDVWTKSSVTFTATVASEYIYVPITTAASTAGQFCYVDDVKVTAAADLDYAVSSVYNNGGVLDGPVNLLSVTPGVPITAAIDVRTEQPARQAQISIYWTDAAQNFVGTAASSSYTVLTSGHSTRLVQTGTPPVGAAFCVVIVGVYTQGFATNAVVGERVWYDNVYAGTDASGAYYDGDTPAKGDYSYRWTGTENLSASERYVQTYVPGPAPTADDCYDRIGRSLHNVTTTTGPTVTQKMTMTDGGTAWSVTWTMVAANPAEFGVERPLVQGFLDPDVAVPYVGGVIPPGGAFDEDGSTQTDADCAVTVFRPVYDPLCSLLVPPPDVPTVVPTCFSFPASYRRTSFVIPRENIPLWTDVAPIISVTTKLNEARTVRVRFYADQFDTGTPAADPCNFCADLVFSYVPPHSTLVLDCADRQVYIDTPGFGRRRADTLVSDSKGNPFEWPEFSCGFGYTVTVDLLLQQPAAPVIDLSLVPRMV
jgi:hypothetical protein